MTTERSGYSSITSGDVWQKSEEFCECEKHCKKCGKRKRQQHQMEWYPYQPYYAPTYPAYPPYIPWTCNANL